MKLLRSWVYSWNKSFSPYFSVSANTPRRMSHSKQQNRDLYSILGVNVYCSEKEIKLAFYKKAKLLHPDGKRKRSASSDGGDDADFVELALAYEVIHISLFFSKRIIYLTFFSQVLSNAQSRKIYDTKYKESKFEGFRDNKGERTSRRNTFYEG